MTARFFYDDVHRAAFKAILAHHSEYQQPPSQEAFGRDFPTYRLSDAPDPLDYYLDEIKHAHKNTLLEYGLSDAVDAWKDDDPAEALQILTRTIADVNSEISSSRIVDITQTGPQRVDRYKAYSKREGSLRGISSGFHSIDQYTQGWQPGQFIVFVGPPAAGKSTLMLLAAMAAHRTVYSPAFFGFEMSNEEQEERYDAIRAGVSHTKLRSGRLPSDDIEKIAKAMRRDELLRPLHFSEDISSTTTVSGLSAQIDRLNPSIVFVDGMYMMEDDQGELKGSPAAITNVTRSLKRLAQVKRIPVVGSTQVLLWKMDRKKGVTQNSIGYSSSFLQDADGLIAVEQTDDPQVNKLKSLKQRNAPGFEVLVEWDWETGRFQELEDVERRDDEDPAKF